MIQQQFLMKKGVQAKAEKSTKLKMHHSEKISLCLPLM
jgi:hypothetical protein